jgi:DnaJ-class molecular chaperone
MPSVSKRDYYETLGVDRTASDDDLKKAYRKMARQHHPDLQTGEAQKKASEEKFKEVNEAYETLSDQDKRKRYVAVRMASDLEAADSATPSTTSSRIFSGVSEAALGRSAATTSNTISN